MRLGARLRRLPLRVRLVAGFSAAMLVLLTAVGAFVYWRVEYALDRGLDSELGAATAVVAPLVGPGGRIGPRGAADATGTGWQVLAADGTVLDSGGPAPAAALVPASRLAGVDPTGRTMDLGSLLPVSEAPYRVRITPLAEGSAPAAYVVLAVRRDHRDEALRELLLQMFLAGAGALVIASLVGDVLARLALRPVERYRRRAAEISAEVATGFSHLRLDVPPERDDEVTRLGHTLNEMLSAIDASLDRERQFVGDASHELRTPLTLLRSRIQVARRRERSAAEHEAVLDELAVDVTRLADLAEQLLELDRADRERQDGPSCGTDLRDVVAREVERWHAAHPERDDDVVLEPSSDPVVVPTAPQVVERVVTNLLTNALVHGLPPVRLGVRREGGCGILQVVDEGPGMSPELLAQATRRFSRAPEARSRPGSGLGLALVETLVAKERGEVRLCHAGHHTSTGTAVDVACHHGGSMTVSVLLPLTVHA